MREEAEQFMKDSYKSYKFLQIQGEMSIFSAARNLLECRQQDKVSDSSSRKVAFTEVRRILGEWDLERLPGS